MGMVGAPLIGGEILLTSEPTVPTLKLDAAFGYGPDDPALVWTNVYDTSTQAPYRVRGVRFDRGRQSILQRFDAGTSEIVLGNENRDWDPQNAASPLYPNVKPMLPFRFTGTIRGVTQHLFHHNADGWPRRRQGPNYAEVAVTAIDATEGFALARIPPDQANATIVLTGINNDLVFTARQPGPDGNNISVVAYQTHFRPLRHQTVVIGVDGPAIRIDFIDDNSVEANDVIAAIQASPAANALITVANAPGSDGTGTMIAFPETKLAGGDTVEFPAELGGARINRCLDQGNWPTTTRQISTGRDLHQALAFPTQEDGKLLSHMQDIAAMQAENGLLFIDGRGYWVFRDRRDKLVSPYNTPVLTFSDMPTGAELGYVDAVPNYGKDLILNDAMNTRDGGQPQNAYDTDSVHDYRRRSATFTTTLSTDIDAKAAAEMAVAEFGQPLQRIESITVMPGNDPLFWANVLALEIGHRIRVVEHPPPLGTPGIDTYTVLVIHANGAQGSTSFQDAAHAHPLSASGGAQVDTSQSVFGGGSAVFTGTSQITATDSSKADWDFGSGDFTLDLWARFSSVAADATLLGQWISLNRSWKFGLRAGVGMRFMASNDGSATPTDKTFLWIPTTGVWYHLALVRTGNVLRFFVNGVQQGTDGTDAITHFQSSTPFRVGLTGDVTEPFAGWLDEIRVSKGIARWTANFTPPAAPYVAANAGDYIVQGMQWQIPDDIVATAITYRLWPADPISNWMVADDTVRGLLDHGNRAGR